MKEEVGMPLTDKNGNIVKCDCGGTYKWSGKLLLSYPAQYPFYCDKCNNRIRVRESTLFPERFPEFRKK